LLLDHRVLCERMVELFLKVLSAVIAINPTDVAAHMLQNP
jgi:hypothetical protein